MLFWHSFFFVGSAKNPISGVNTKNTTNTTDATNATATPEYRSGSAIASCHYAIPPAGVPPVPVFLRMPTGPGRQLCPGSNLNYWKLRKLIAPGLWNFFRPPVAAYRLVKPNQTRGTILIEYSSLQAWLDPNFNASTVTIPPIFNLPKGKDFCPYTGIKRTVLYELSLSQSPYGTTRIRSWMQIPPGNKTGVIAIDAKSLVDYIRTLPPPSFAISPSKFVEPPSPSIESAGQVPFMDIGL